MRPSHQPMKSRLASALFSFAMVSALSFQSIPTAASASSDLKHMFRGIDRQLCHAFSVDRCQQQKSRKAKKVQPESTPAPIKPDKIEKPVETKIPPKAEEAKTLPAPAMVAPPQGISDHGSITLTPRKVARTQVPLPRLRPDKLGAEGNIASPAPPPPVPDKKKDEVVIIKPVPSPLVQTPATSTPPVLPPSPHLMPDDTLAGEACLAELQKLGVKFDRPAIPVGAGSCLVSDPVKLTGVLRDGVMVNFPDAPTFNCGFAVRFANWVTEQAEPIVQTGLNSKIATIGTGPGYQCRGRNGDSSAKLSEHAFGNAADIERIKLANGEVIEVSNAIDTTSKYQPVLANLRAAGCQYFTTVLGPGTNSAHATHFHFDLERRGKKGDNKMCQ